MVRTHLIQNDGTQAVQLPSEVAYDDMGIELEVTHAGDVVTFFPARQNLKAMVEALRRLPKPTRVQKRAPIEMPDREWD